MNEKKWEQIKEIFHQAQSLPVEDRVEFLDRACAEGPARSFRRLELAGGFHTG